MADLTRTLRVPMNLARRLLFPKYPQIILLEKLDEGGYVPLVSASLALSTVSALWYAVRAKSFEMVNNQVYRAEVLDFYLLDGATPITFENYRQLNAVQMGARLFEVKEVREPLEEPRLWKVTCHPHPRPVPAPAP